ncbi:MAG: hypothetical protein GY720_23560 [bacterium]|nr:hypothetical protein [bacterium]
MAANTFLVIGAVGMVLLVVSAFLGADDADLDMDADIDVDLEADLDSDVHGGAVGGGILEWVSIKGLSVGAVGFGFVGWATTTNGYSAIAVWLLSILVGVALWALAVKFLFPMLKSQQGDDMQAVESYSGLTAEVVVRIPANGVGTVQFTDPHGMVVRRDARSNHKDHEVAAGKQVLVLLSTAEHVVVDEFSFLEDI